MLTNSLEVNEALSVSIATEEDCCNKCLEAYTKEHRITYVKAREELKGRLTGKRVFKIRFHGGTYILCADHLKQIADLVVPKDTTTPIDDLSDGDKAALASQLSHLKNAAPAAKKGPARVDLPMPDSIADVTVNPAKRSRKKNETKDNA